MKRAVVITTFVSYLEAFSLCGVVATHLKALIDAGYTPSLVACQGFEADGIFAHPALRRHLMPVASLRGEDDAVQKPARFRDDVEAIKAALRPVLAQADVALTHDVVYLPTDLTYNVACRALAEELPHLRWLHWIHSAPEAHRSFPEADPRRARFSPFPNSQIVYPNAYDVPRVAQQYAMPERDVRVVPHALDYEALFAFHPLTCALVERFDLYAPDIFAIYPIRLDRGKQAEKLVRLFAALKQTGRSVRLLVVNFHSTGAHFIAYRDEIRKEAAGLGLSDEEVIFTNRIDALPGIDTQDLHAYRIEFPRKVVLDLFHLTNVYVHPSASETYSLVCQEAAACGNLLFLNDDFPPMRELYGAAAKYVKFSSSLFTTTYTPNETAYYADVARQMLYHLQSEHTIQQKTRLRQTRNLQTVFRTHLEPLLYME